MREPDLAMQFEDFEQQAGAAELGIWVFLATEILFFGGLFLAYAVYRSHSPEAFALAGRRLDVTIGTVNTALLLTSSFFMALAVDSAKQGRHRGVFWQLVMTELLGLLFLGLKAKEYSQDLAEHLVPGASCAIQGTDAPPARMFYFIYYAMTGLHALHLSIGLALIFRLIWRSRDGSGTSRSALRVEIVGLYWHFVDAVWVFLYPLLYLMDRHS